MGAKPSCKSYPKPSMLHLTASSGDARLIPIYLKEHEVDLFCSLYGTIVLTPLMCAARNGHEEAVRLLLEAGANPSAVSPDTGTSVLYYAADCGHANIVTMLLKAGAMIDTRDHEGRTALYVAALAGFDKVVRILISTHANLDITTNEGMTALMAAADRGHEKCVRHLLHAGADFTEVASKDGYTCLHAACAGGSVAVVKLLLGWGVQSNFSVVLVDGNAASTIIVKAPLYLAAQHGSVDIIRILLDAGADIDWTTPQGVSALHATAAGGHDEALNTLLDAHAVIDVVDSKGSTPLMAAASNGQDKCVRLLLEAGADISKATTDRGFTALHAASLEGSVDVVKTLLEWKADVHAKDRIGRTPIWFAANRKHDNVVKVLEEAGAEPYISVTDAFLDVLRATYELVLEVVRVLFKSGVYCCAQIVTKTMKVGIYGVVTAVSVAYIILKLIVLVFIYSLKVLDHFTGLDMIATIRKHIDNVDSEANDKSPEQARKDTTDIGTITFKHSHKEIDSEETVDESSALLPSKEGTELHVRSTANAAVGSVYSEIDDDTPEPSDALEEADVEEKQQHKIQQPCLNCQTQTHKRCAGCKITFFCSRECQRATYKDHKPVCLEICEEKRRAKAEREARRAATHAEIE